MPKRGQRATHRIYFRWENGLHGTISCPGWSYAEAKLVELRDAATFRGMPVEVTVQRRSFGDRWEAKDRYTIQPEERETK